MSQAGDPSHTHTGCRRRLGKRQFERFVWDEIEKRLTFASIAGTGFRSADGHAGGTRKLQAAAPPRSEHSTHARSRTGGRAMSPPLVFIAGGVLSVWSLFEIFPIQSRQPQLRRSPVTAEAMSNNWSGAYIRDNDGETYTRIQGSWIVPRPYPPPPQASWRRLAALVLHRCDCLARAGRLRSGKPAMPQIGTYQEVVRDHATQEPQPT